MRARLLAASLATLILPAAAAADTVAVLGVEAIDAPESTANELAEALRARARDTGVKLAPNKDFMEVKMLYGCTDPSSLTTCLAQAGKSLGADRFIVGTITGHKRKRHERHDPRLQVKLQLVDAASGQVVKSVDGQVTAAEISGQAGGWLSQLVPPVAQPTPLTPPTRKPTEIVVTTSPPDATITVDGRAVGRSPATLPVFGPASHTIVISKQGFQDVTRSIEVKAGESARLSLTLEAVAAQPVVVSPTPPNPIVTPPVVPAAEHPGRSLKIAGGVALAAGLAAIGVEIYTWRTYLSYSDRAHTELTNLARYNPDYAAQHPDYFQKPSCTPPSSPTALPDSKNLRDYERYCNDGHSFASASTGLLIGGIVVGVVGAALIGAGVYQAGKADKHPAAARLKLLSPVVTREGGGITAAFEF